MPYYYTIQNKTEAGRRTARNLLEIKKELRRQIPRRTISDTLLLATWNIREFDSSKYGTRTAESFQYIAEIVSHFDLVAIQEVRDDLRAIDQLRWILGRDTWDYILTDVTEGSGGNRERMAFLYDSKKVRFGGLAGEVVLPERLKAGKLDVPRQLARTPFVVGFEVGWFRFMLCTVHIYYGESKAVDARRLKEIEELSNFLAKRAKHEFAWAEDMILLGDFNIFKPEDATFEAIRKAGFIVPERIQRLPSNVPQNKHYDQIAFFAPRVQDQLEEIEAGVFNFFDLVYREDDQETYVPEMGKAYEKTSKGAKRTAAGKTRHYRDWRTHQMSDHLPMWVKLKIDFGEEYLEGKTKPPGEGG
ncbi:MAG TPA: endonuclease/exonuclease/phosphatase family protein [Gemmatimonadota bacterium]|nr:endonuclease/exonuclease/phosphatase family protein [Gemmatimonadota bacterium]